MRVEDLGIDVIAFVFVFSGLLSYFEKMLRVILKLNIIAYAVGG